MSQLVMTPEEATDLDFVAAAEKAVEREQSYAWGWGAAKIRISRVLHPMGIHMWVKYRTFDMSSDRIINWPGHWVCLWCPRGKIE